MKMNRLRLISVATIIVFSSIAYSDEVIDWPGDAKVAITLSYDDAIDSQLDHAAPTLNKHGFKGTFYVTLSSESLRNRMNEWKTLAQQGHELGNHTIYHPCSKSVPDRDWVQPQDDLEKQTVAQILREIVTANTFLRALDGKTLRTYGATCDDTHAGGEYYLSAIESEFVALRGLDHGMAEGSKTIWGPVGVGGEEMIAFVKDNSEDGNLLGIAFHGVGGDYLSVSAEAHDELLQFLADNPDTYWVDSYVNIMTHVRKQLK